ncbi:vascular-related unknown protein 4-like [Apium graveolens]|uniref:vascular-related unknown protein 4-like n=1 Tax=Apium graveolens TaxID=4045 RepID=UPI003D7A7CED
MDTSFASKENLSEDEDSEESGWTSYFDEFFANQKKEQYSSNFQVSDAASGVVDQKKFSESGRLVQSTSTLTKLSKTLDFKKRSKEILYDDSLEDTASSPVNSPKIMQVEGGIPDLRLDGRLDEKTGGVVKEGEGNDCRALKKPGLCLFSMSMTRS